METDGALCEFTTRRGGIDRSQLFAANDGGIDAICKQLRLFTGPKTCERKNRFAYAGFANLFALGGASDAEPIGTRFFEGFGNLRAAVAIAIAFDNAEDFSRGGALFGFRIHEIANGMKIVCERGERNIGPHWPAIYSFYFFLSRHSCFQSGFLARISARLQNSYFKTSSGQRMNRQSAGAR